MKRALDRVAVAVAVVVLLGFLLVASYVLAVVSVRVLDHISDSITENR